MVLADNTLSERFFHLQGPCVNHLSQANSSPYMNQLIPFTLEQVLNGNPRRLGHHPSNVIRRYSIM